MHVYVLIEDILNHKSQITRLNAEERQDDKVHNLDINKAISKLSINY